MSYCQNSVAVLLFCFFEAFGFPAECFGKRKGGKIYFRLSPDNITDTQECDIQWLVNQTTLAYRESIGSVQFKYPVLDLTGNTAIMEVDEVSDKVQCVLVCPKFNINKNLLCSYLAPEHPAQKDHLPGNGTSVKPLNDDFPKWAIGVIVMGIAFVFLVSLLIHMQVRKKYDPVQTPVETI